jgi:hypothetical protein
MPDGHLKGRAQMSDEKTVIQSAVAQPEPWLRGTLEEVSAVPRGVLHALELADEDLEKWCGGLSDGEVNLRPAGLAPVAFHWRHIARSLDRLLTYTEGRTLSPEQLAQLKGEMERGATRAELFAEVEAGVGSKRDSSTRTGEGGSGGA